MFTISGVGWDGVKHLKGGFNPEKFDEIIDMALKCKGFKSNSYAFEKYKKEPELTGYGHKTMTSLLVKPIMEGKIKEIYLIGGCDNLDPNRDFNR